MYLFITLGPTYSNTTRWVLCGAFSGGGIALGWVYVLTLLKPLFGIPSKSLVALNLGGFGLYTPRTQLKGPFRTDAPYFN